MDSIGEVSIVAALVRSVRSNVRDLKSARLDGERRCLLKRIRQLETRLGTEVVTAVSIAVARGRDIEFEIFSGRCVNKQLEVPTSWIQHMYLGNGIGVCPICGAIVLRDDSDRGRFGLASGAAK